MAGGAGFKKLWEGVASLGKAAGPVAEAGVNLGKGTAKVGAGAATGTAGVGAGIIGTALNAVGSFAQKHPKLTFLAVAYAGIKGVQAIVRKRRGGQEEVGAPQAGAAPQAAVAGYGAGAAEFQGTGHQYSPGAPVLQAQPAARSAEPELSPAEQQAFIEALMAAAQQEQGASKGPQAQGPAADQGSWTQRVEAGRQPVVNPQQGR